MPVVKPQPKELVVRRHEINPDYLKLTTGSTDAVAWVEREAPQFGTLYKPMAGMHYYLLQVANVWEVQEYLAGYSGEPPSDGREG